MIKIKIMLVLEGLRKKILHNLPSKTGLPKLNLHTNYNEHEITNAYLYIISRLGN